MAPVPALDHTYSVLRSPLSFYSLHHERFNYMLWQWMGMRL